MNIRYMQQLSQMSTREPGAELDTLNQFLLHHFETELKAFESYKQVSENRQWTATDGIVTAVVDDINMIHLLVDAMRDNVEQLNISMFANETHQSKIIDLEIDVTALIADNLMLQNRVLKLESLILNKQTDEDK